ncbi:MAG: hypothetical protein HOV81_00985 [Kofleriaceae bacterium]|nr:hypothetical protein [Kofleriaceae bacterium]
MSGMRRAGPGPQVSTGRLRVDAGRAIAKLREYQLADRTAWILEGIRAAVAAKATKIVLEGDANDIWLAWEGEPLDVDVLPKLFDELVSPAAEVERQHVRLLAAGVNSALGMDPAYVDVYAVGERTHVARYTPDVLAEPEGELGETALRRVEARVSERPREAPAVGTGAIVHLRRRLGLQVLAYAFGSPPELEVARQACRDIGVPLHVDGGEVLHREHSRDVVRVPLGDGVDGFVAVNELVIGAAQVHVAEHGVILARYPLKLSDDDETADDVPVRLFVDAERMPTNASRSQVRRDKHPISTAEARAKKLVGEVVKRLAAAVNAGDERARATALAWIAAEIGGPKWHTEVARIGGELRELAKLPLVRNALGEPRGLVGEWRPEVHGGRTPYPSELAKWLGNVLWVPPGDAASRLLDGTDIDERAMRRVVRWAKDAARAERKFYSHGKREARVVAARMPRVRARLGAAIERSDVADAAFAGLSGEICVYDEGHGGTLVVLLEGRELERVSMKGLFAFDAVIDSPSVTPSDRYRGVERDSEFKRVERAMQLGIIRALEALAIARKELVAPDGYEIGPDRGTDSDARLFRCAYAFATDLGLRLDGVLSTAPAWETTDGRRIGAKDLTGTIGVTRPNSSPLTPHGRTVVVADDEDRTLIGKLVRGRIVRYDRVHEGGFTDSRMLAQELAQGRPGSLAIPDENVSAAIAPANKSTLQLRHVGVKLATHPYKSQYLDCAIVVDSHAIVPDTDWKATLDDAGLLAKSYGAWELALVRAIAWTIAGERSPELLGPPVIEIGRGLGLALCEAIERGDPQAMLGDELLAKLRAAPIVDVLGGARRHAIAEVAEMFAGATLPFVAATSEPVAGFRPVVATERVAKAIAKLCGKKVSDATGELARRHKRALFETRLAEHCAQPAESVPLPGNGRVEVVGQYVRGTVALSDGPCTIRVLVENRPLTTLRPAVPIPVEAVVELAAYHCGDTFEGVDASLAARISTDVRASVPALLDAIAQASPEKLADPGHARTLLHDWVGNLEAEAAQKLVRTIPFRTIQGGRATIEQASQPRMVLSTADWNDAWLGSIDDEPTSAYDEPILCVPRDDGQLARILSVLFDHKIADASEEVARLQARRRMARGLLPVPKVAGIAPELRRSLADLPEAKKLGPGEIGLAMDAPRSVARIHKNGRFDRAVDIAVEPPIQLAIEEQVLDVDLVQKLARKLVADAVRETPFLITLTMRRHLFRAALGKKLDPDMLGDVPVCETRLDWYPWSSFAEQLAHFGNVWAVATSTRDASLDPRRLVFVLDNDAITRATKHGYLVIEATSELALDAQARRNRSKPAATSLALPTENGVLAQVELDGDGTTAPRGTVAILAPAAKASRGLYPHRAMHPFTRSDDPCSWPTLAIVDDARLEPDRTWASLKADGTWQALHKGVRTASERALATLCQPPAGALVSLRVDVTASADIKELRRSAKSQVRGAVWLSGTPYEDLRTIQVTHPTGVRTFASHDELAMGGNVLLHADGQLDHEAVLEQLAGAMYGKLVRELLKARAGRSDDVVGAHVAHALALQSIKPTEARAIELTCFAPRPLDARGWVSLVRRHGKVPLIAPGETTDADIAVIDDGSATARVVIEHLGDRLRRQREERQRIPTPAPPQPVIVKSPPEKPAPKRPPPPAPKPPHPLQALVERLSKRVGELGIEGHEWAIEDIDEPMFQFQFGELVVAGNNKRLRALAAAQLANTAWFDDALDAVAAHVVTVLNVSLTQITDATEVAALHALLAPRRSQG